MTDLGEIVKEENIVRAKETKRREGWTPTQRCYIVKWYQTYADTHTTFRMFDDFPVIFKSTSKDLKKDVLRLSAKANNMKESGEFNQIRDTLDKYGLEATIKMIESGSELSTKYTLKTALCKVCKAQAVCGHTIGIYKKLGEFGLPDGIEVDVTKCKYMVE